MKFGITEKYQGHDTSGLGPVVVAFRGSSAGERGLELQAGIFG